MNTQKLQGDRINALCELIRGDTYIDNTKYPLNPVRYRLNDMEYPLGDGMVLMLDHDKTRVINHTHDYKVRSDRKVTNKVNKIFKEYMVNAAAMAQLMKPEQPQGTRWGWDEAAMAKYAKDHLGTGRLRWEYSFDNAGLINNPQKLLSRYSEFDPDIDDDTGVIKPTKGFAVPKLINEAAKVNNFAPMAYILLERPGANTEKRLLTAMRALEGGFRIEEV